MAPQLKIPTFDELMSLGLAGRGAAWQSTSDRGDDDSQRVDQTSSALAATEVTGPVM